MAQADGSRVTDEEGPPQIGPGVSLSCRIGDEAWVVEPGTPVVAIFQEGESRRVVMHGNTAQLANCGVALIEQLILRGLSIPDAATMLRAGVKAATDKSIQGQDEDG